MIAWRAVALSFVLALGACSGSAEEPPERRAPSETRGEERGGDRVHGTAIALREDGPDVPPASRFERVDASAATRAERARSWAGLRGDEYGRASVGNFACRLRTLFGAPTETRADGFTYALRDRDAEVVITAYVDARGPAFGGVAGADPERAAASVEALAARVDATRPEPCDLTIAGRHVGVRDAEWFVE